MDLSRSFKAYDVRGRIPDELNPDAVYRIGRAYAAWLRPRRVAVGRDIRQSSEEFANALISGLTESGVDVVVSGIDRFHVLNLVGIDVIAISLDAVAPCRGPFAGPARVGIAIEVCVPDVRTGAAASHRGIRIGGRAHFHVQANIA